MDNGMLRLLGELIDGKKEHLTGFWEGDGSVKVSNGVCGIEVIFSQKESQILEYVSTLIGFGKDPNWTVSGVYQLIVGRQEEALALLRLFCRYLVCPQRGEQLWALSYVNGWGLDVKLHKPTIPWTVGFWDAEGSSEFINGGVGLTIYQKDARVLEGIRSLVGGGVRTAGTGGPSLWLNGSNARRFIPHLLRYSRNVKKLSELREKLCVAVRVSPTWAEEFELVRR